MPDINEADNKIGIFGGAFNPIHFGHLRAAEEVREKLCLEKILFIPSYNPPLKNTDLADAGHRYEMTRLAIGGHPFFVISDIECRKSGKSYTVETLTALKGIYPQKEFYLILGIDSFMDIPAWYEPQQLMELTNFVVISRPGYSFSSILTLMPDKADIVAGLDNGRLKMYKTMLKSGRDLYLLNIMPLNISATAIRMFSRDGLSIKYLLPEKVESYIISNKLYGQEQLS